MRRADDIIISLTARAFRVNIEITEFRAGGALHQYTLTCDGPALRTVRIGHLHPWHFVTIDAPAAALAAADAMVDE